MGSGAKNCGSQDDDHINFDHKWENIYSQKQVCTYVA